MQACRPVWTLVAACLLLAMVATAHASLRAQGSSTSRPAAFTAFGNEPGWRLDIADGQLTFTTAEGGRSTFPAPRPEVVPGGRRFRASANGQRITVVARDEVCADTMTGMPRPNRVEITLGSATYRGCGGDPASLLRGAAWTVIRISGVAPVDGSRPTVAFGADGRVSGNSSCNMFSATYTLTGEGLAIGQAVSTRRACPPPLMEQEDSVLRTLVAVRRFELRPDKILVLHADDGRRIEARRE